jgi:geranylgeranyl diphosphate synthase type II
MNQNITRFQAAFEGELAAFRIDLPHDNLHEPVHYILGLGGKRIRPVLVMLAGEAFGASVERSLPAALAVELFHNFSLVHDDIMDAAPLRRGKPTVHHKWNQNTAILSGDAMLIEAYKQLARCGVENLPALLDLFNVTAAEVCLGQQYDMDFEKMPEVGEARYIEMITLKTAVLLGCSLKMGALIAGATNEDCDRIYNFGKMAGLAFQIQDDYLDAFGNPDSFGKQVGGDILANKKTLLSTYALQVAEDELKVELTAMFADDHQCSPDEKVARVQDIFRSTAADVHALDKAHFYFTEAEALLKQLNLPTAQKAVLDDFLDGLRVRQY